MSGAWAAWICRSQQGRCGRSDRWHRVPPDRNGGHEPRAGTPLEKPAIKIEVPEGSSPSGQPGPAPLWPVANLLAKADVGAGEAYANKVCSACHTFNQGGPAKIGPNLYNVVGGPHAHMKGFNYSNALKSKQGP
jgi:cytochrome c